MPHPLPPSQPYSNGLRWFLVAVPDEDAFVRAAMAAYTDLGKFYNWGLEGPTDGSNEAAALFNAAAAETLRAWEMSLLDTLIESIDEVETLLRALQTTQRFSLDCCDHVVPIPPTPPDIPTVPPATWGENTVVADEDHWDALRCGAAHAYVDYLIAAANSINDLIAIGGVTIGAIAGLLALLSGAGILAAVGYEFAAGAVTAVLSYVGGVTFDTAAEDFETYRTDLVCAILTNDPAALRTWIESLTGILYDLFFQWIDFETALSVIATGNYEDANLDPVERYDCDCDAQTYSLVPITVDSVSTPNGGTAEIYGSYYRYYITFTGNADKIMVMNITETPPANTQGVLIRYEVMAFPAGGSPNAKADGKVGNLPGLLVVGEHSTFAYETTIAPEVITELQSRETPELSVQEPVSGTYQQVGIDYNSASGLYEVRIISMDYVVQT